MINVYSSADVRDMDRVAIESGVPSLTLMEAARTGALRHIEPGIAGHSGPACNYFLRRR